MSSDRREDREWRNSKAEEVGSQKSRGVEVRTNRVGRGQRVTGKKADKRGLRGQKVPSGLSFQVSSLPPTVPFLQSLKLCQCHPDDLIHVVVAVGGKTANETDIR